jgi:hypothetical protein
MYWYALLAIMVEVKATQQDPSHDKRLHLLSKELEEAANQFLAKLEQLEKLLPEVNE